MNGGVAVALEDRDPCHDLRVEGIRLTCDWAGCLFVPDEETLIVSDLHLEKGSSYARRGQHLPPYDTRQTLTLLAHRLAVWQPRRVICLGDSFHDATGHERLSEPCRLALTAMMKGRDWVWIEGNHDPLPPATLGGDCAPTIELGPLTLCHEPQRGLRKGEIAGHLHPSGKVVRRSRSVRRPCFVTDGSRLIMPSFGAYTGGLNIRDRAFDGLFDQERMSAVLLGRERVFHIAARFLVA